MNKTFLADMTWQEFQDALGPDTVVVIPMGSVELEGLHLPLGVDTIVAEGVARELDGQEGVVIGPEIPMGYSKWFTPYPGTITLEQDTLVRLLLDYCRSLVKHNVSRIVFLNAHKGNNAAIDTAAHTLIQDHGVKVGMLSVWKLANDLIDGKDLIAEGRFTHAGEIMTSLMLALRPETVVNSQIRADRVKPIKGSDFDPKNSLGDTGFRGVVQTVYQDIRNVTDTGVLGDPSAATVEKGRKLLEMIAEYAQAFLQEFRRI
ncbi:MAG: creatininase family protein [Desulfarculaceae bacterium]|jgi:creatinine amidohydrolase